jgi:hypothetical protein
VIRDSERRRRDLYQPEASLKLHTAGRVEAVKQPELDDFTKQKETKSGRGVRALIPLCRDDIELFKTIMEGEHYIRELYNSDIGSLLIHSSHLHDFVNDTKKQSAKVSRILSRFHAQ